MSDLEATSSNVPRNSMRIPKITGAYASLINSDLHDDLQIPRAGPINPIMAAQDLMMQKSNLKSLESPYGGQKKSVSLSQYQSHDYADQQHQRPSGS